MRFQRATDPVLYRLVHENREIGALTRGGDGDIVFSLHGFRTRDAAASAARAAHSARLAFDAQRPGSTPVRTVGRALALLAGGLGRRGARTEVREFIAREEADSVHLYLAQEVGSLTRAVPADGADPIWSMAVRLDRDTPSLFAMAAARRMWGAVQSSGLWRQMVQWHTSPVPSPAA